MERNGDGDRTTFDMETGLLEINGGIPGAGGAVEVEVAVAVGRDDRDGHGGGETRRRVGRSGADKRESWSRSWLWNSSSRPRFRSWTRSRSGPGSGAGPERREDYSALEHAWCSHREMAHIANVIDPKIHWLADGRDNKRSSARFIDNLPVLFIAVP